MNFPVIGDGIPRELSAYVYHYRLILHVVYTQTHMITWLSPLGMKLCTVFILHS